MKRCVVCGRETYHKVEEYTVCAACDVDGSFDYYIKQSIAAQQGVQPTVLCTCKKNYFGTTVKIDSRCAFHYPHSG